MAFTTSQADVKLPTLEPGTSILQITLSPAAADTTGTHTFARAFSAAPTVIGISRDDAVASTVYIARISTLSATQIGVTLSAAATGAESFKVLLLGKFAATA